MSRRVQIGLTIDVDLPADMDLDLNDGYYALCDLVSDGDFSVVEFDLFNQGPVQPQPEKAVSA